MTENIFARIDPDRIHSVGLGSFRMPREFHHNIVRLYPEEPLFTSPVEIDKDGLVTYPAAIREEMLDHVSTLLLKWVSPRRLFNHERD